MARARVVIVGGGFAGLVAAKGLARAPVDVTLVDRRNHHVFQPLLYQVATAGLSPAQIATPIRSVLKRQRNTRVLLGEVERVDVARRVVRLSPDGPGASEELPYDVLVLAPGVTHSYFGRDEWAPFAPGLKTIEDALEIRRRFLLAFERAERAGDEATRQAELTFVVVGGGPTGVEMAGAMIEIAVRSIPREFRRADTRRARVVLVEAQDRLLPSGFPEALSRRAQDDLLAMGVDVRLATRVVGVDARGVTLATPDAPGTQRLDARNVIWAAGVRPSPLAASLGVPLDRAGRVVVEPDLTAPGHPNVFVLGDLARVIDPATGREVPGMAPGAMQMGRHAARLIAARASGQPIEGERRAFRFTDKGVLATIGRARAVASIGGVRFSGFAAWIVWAVVHILYLITFRAKLIVMLEWAWAYVFFSRGARLITGGAAPVPGTPSAAGLDRPPT